MTGSIITPQVVAYAAQECAWQGSGELSVGWMIQAWAYAHRQRNRMIRQADVIMLGRRVEPLTNIYGLRTCEVRVGAHVMPPAERVPAALLALINTQPVATALRPVTEAECADWFRQYEEIHPFRDGNGRTGSILYNWLRGSLPEPVHPPNLFGDPRRGGETPYPVPTLAVADARLPVAFYDQGVAYRIAAG